MTTDAEITFADFEKVALRAGTIIAAEPFPAARRPAIKLTIDFGPFGTKQSSAQITDLYEPENLVGKQIVAVTNFPAKRIAGFKSEVLVTGFANENAAIVLIAPDQNVPNGVKLC